MNGYLSGRHIGRELAKLGAEFDAAGAAETFNVITMAARIGQAVDALRLAAIADIDEVAVEIVAADALASNPLNSGTWHRVQNIKDVRERTGSGLLEAKQAVERAYPVVARNIAVMALTALEAENDKVGYGLHERVNATDHRFTLDNLADAAKLPSF